MRGKVYLIGAGPGDPALLTVKGRDCLARADVVVYDALISKALLGQASPKARRWFVGKRKKQHAMEQSQINRLMAREARAGRIVARLKGGDPFLFGRGGEEAAYLAGQGIPFEVVPGVSSASGVAAYSGIPLTDRRLGSMVTLVTGHERSGALPPAVEWSRISRRSTLVIFMGLHGLERITQRLLKLHWDRRLPAAVVRWGSLPSQQVIEGTLGDIAAKTRAAGLESPALIILGRVVGLRRKLRWFESKPLFGRRIVITRAADQAADFAARLTEAGAEVLSFPTIELIPPRSWKPLDTALRRLDQFDWILFTSANGVERFFERLRHLGGDVRRLYRARVGAIGPKTARRLEQRGLRVSAFPAEYRAEALAEAIGKVRGARILLARAEQAREVLPETLRARGARVTVAPVYRTRKPQAPELRAALLSERIDAVTFTSSSTVDGFMQHFSPAERAHIFSRACAAAIGPITASTLARYGIRPAIQAPRYTTEALAEAIRRHFA